MQNPLAHWETLQNKGLASVSEWARTSNLRLRRLIFLFDRLTKMPADGTRTVSDLSAELQFISCLDFVPWKIYWTAGLCTVYDGIKNVRGETNASEEEEAGTWDGSPSQPCHIQLAVRRSVETLDLAPDSDIQLNCLREHTVLELASWSPPAEWCLDFEVRSAMPSSVAIRGSTVYAK